jgi:hypothetical protein
MFSSHASSPLTIADLATPAKKQQVSFIPSDKTPSTHAPMDFFTPQQTVHVPAERPLEDLEIQAGKANFLPFYFLNASVDACRLLFG